MWRRVAQEVTVANTCVAQYLHKYEGMLQGRLAVEGVCMYEYDHLMFASCK